MSNIRQEPSKPKHKHNKWTAVEDKMLKSLVSKSTKPNWVAISNQIPNRNPRQCQERWEYYLSPNVNNSPWTPQEDALLLKKYQEYGTKWTIIAKFFYNRTNTNVKNRFLAINRYQKQTQPTTEIEEVTPQCEKVILPNIMNLDAVLPTNFLNRVAMLDSASFLSTII
ncbi:Myb-like DNA-binding domain containing protein [Trichomonas vaginalis G3]|uniref:Myb-like DNA-binding domain containing protein n=1 Tax=Trichomonas vaginalis (strain ATCC PRA-98 / G3) TaxID=412133 RepID=A2EBM3_TRIV3|nr:RNA polymerase II transcription regulator recruiting protein [Trichomonas vaginalis G3]EAY09940.1 Myb-like DNA-binding domain containing protein [Trichomonas vaginalis G3]KAI5523081.1 RNA polymerase II transcription regulator recruiting protein [Trichomonas vaginalis G3]|eukprot:XP_001322163.1 Myb-like DNA-binding domain containing protein [Trichomonas vaginalis G3]